QNAVQRIIGDGGRVGGVLLKQSVRAEAIFRRGRERPAEMREKRAEGRKISRPAGRRLAQKASVRKVDPQSAMQENQALAERQWPRPARQCKPQSNPHIRRAGEYSLPWCRWFAPGARERAGSCPRRRPRTSP